MSAPLRLPVVEEPVRPRTRAECRDGERPCPWASCVHHTVAARFRASGELAHDEAIFAEVFEGGEAAPMSCELDARVADRLIHAQGRAIVGPDGRRVIGPGGQAWFVAVPGGSLRRVEARLALRGGA